MRIGIDIRCLQDGGRTGVEEYTLGVLRSMFEQDQDDTFVLFSNSRKEVRLPEFSYPNVELKRFSFPNKIFNTSLKIFRYPKIDKLIGGADVFFVPSFRLAPCSSKCLMVATFHDLSFVRHPKYFSRKRSFWHWLMEPRKMVLEARKTIAVSKTTANDLIELYGTAPEKISVIHSGINERMGKVDRGSAEVREVKKRYNLPDRFILFLGTIEPRKNLEGLIAAFSLIRERDGVGHDLVIAGARGWIKESFFENVKNNKWSRNIHLTGFVRDEDKPALYSLADLFVYPSFYEGFGFPPLEALACGTPVITSYNSSIPEIAGAYATLVNPYDTQEIAEVMSQKLMYPQMVSEEVSSEIKKRYDWQRAGRETLNLLK